MKTLFINPPYTDISKPSEAVVPPLGMSYIISYLKENGIDADIVDCTPLSIDNKKLVSIIIKKNPSFVGISSNTPLIKNALEVADLIKKVNPNIKVILGGPHVTALPKETLQVSKSTDIAVIGEGELTCLELIRELKKKEPNLKRVKGIAFKHGGRVVITHPRPLIQDLDKLPFPARDILSMDKYRPSIKWIYRSPFATMITSRGCPYRCKFCGSHLTFGRKTRFMSAENVIAEIEELINRYGIKEILFYDDTFTLHRQRTFDICNMIIKKKLDITWGCLCKVNIMDEKILRIMKRAGCHMISYGLESGSDRMLKLMNKSQTTEQGERAVKLTKKAGIECNGSFIFGMPGETRESMLKTIKWVKKVNPTYAIFTKAVPFPGTEVYRDLVEEKKLDNQDWSNYLLFVDAKPVIKLDTISANEFDRLIKKAWRKFYLRPFKIMSYVFRTTSYYRLAAYLRALKTFFQLQGLAKRKAEIKDNKQKECKHKWVFRKKKRRGYIYVAIFFCKKCGKIIERYA